MKKNCITWEMKKVTAKRTVFKKAEAALQRCSWEKVL